MTDTKDDIVLRVLRESPTPLTVHQIRRRMKSTLKAHEVLESLGRLQERSEARLIHGAKWESNASRIPVQAPQPSARIQRDGRNQTKTVTSERVGERDPRATQANVEPSGWRQGTRWDEFRRMCCYYAECIRNEDQSNVMVYADREGDRFISIPASHSWRSIASGSPIALRIQTEWVEFVRYIVSQKSHEQLFLGGPTYVHVGQDKETKEHYRQVSPLFFVSVSFERSGDMLHIQPDGQFGLNQNWVNRRFRKREDRATFQELCGVGSFSSADAADPSGELKSFDQVYRDLSRYYETWWKEPLNIRHPEGGLPLGSVEETGIYNRAVLVSLPRLKYMWRLHRELSQLAQVTPDEELDRSALAHLFPHEPAYAEDVEGDSNHRSTSVRLASDLLPAEVVNLNEEQAEACRLAANEPVVVVKGPPGTGKSRVVNQVMVDAAIQQRPCLFASRNHQALAAVVPKLNAMTEPYPIVIQVAQKYGETGGTRTLLHAVSDMIDRPRPAELIQERDAVLDSLQRQLADLRDVTALIDEVVSLSKQLESSLADLTHQLDDLPPEYESKILDIPNVPSVSILQEYSDQLSRLNSEPVTLVDRILTPIRRWWIRKTIIPAVSECVGHFERVFKERHVEHSDWSEQELRQALPIWIRVASAIVLAGKVQHHRSMLENLRSLSDCYSRWARLKDQAIQTARRVVELVARTQGGELTGRPREAMAELRAMLQNYDEEDFFAGRKFHELLRGRMESILPHLPLWATTNLSAGRHLPMVSGLFDLLIIDEAGQCDIPSVIPLLYRSRRVMVVGDPQQLQHISTLDRELEHAIRDRFGLTADVSQERFTHRVNSFFSLADGSSEVAARIQLRDHHRSHHSIAAYCNECFYTESLNVMTDCTVLNASAGRVGIEWTDTPDDTESAPGSGSLSHGQIEAVVEELTRLISDGFAGTVGVVTPFRAQANRIRDRVQSVLGDRIPPIWQFDVNTADGFQGGERDVILLSLVGGSSMPRGSRTFLNENPNRFNVAVSRAKSLLHIFGNIQWAKGCGIAHVSKLLQAFYEQHREPTQNIRTDLIGPVWEPRFADEMTKVGLPFKPQYPVLNRFYLDFALVREGRKIAIEVDGEAFHRTHDGGRKVDDVRRDMSLIAAGWIVQRFWVYELRENMGRCIETVQRLWEA